MSTVTATLSGLVVFETRLGQRVDGGCALVAVPGGFALFECC